MNLTLNMALILHMTLNMALALSLNMILTINMKMTQAPGLTFYYEYDTDSDSYSDSESDYDSDKYSTHTTPLHSAASKGHIEICRLIMDHLADKNPKNDWDVPPSTVLSTLKALKFIA